MDNVHRARQRGNWDQPMLLLSTVLRLQQTLMGPLLRPQAIENIYISDKTRPDREVCHQFPQT